MTIAEQVYNMLTMKQKRQLEEELNIDCATDLRKRIVDEYEDEVLFYLN